MVEYACGKDGDKLHLNEEDAPGDFGSVAGTICAQMTDRQS